MLLANNNFITSWFLMYNKIKLLSRLFSNFLEEIMKKSNRLTLSRRGFISSASGLMLGSCFLGLLPAKLLAAGVQETIEELTPEELKWVEQSVMAEDLKNYFHKDYS
jgi:hypothetical protein